MTAAAAVEAGKRRAKAAGAAGEARAAEFLRRAGYGILARNWRCRKGEIDIIAQRGETVVFAEVKTLPSGGFEALEGALGAKKQKRIIETAKCFLANNRQYSRCFVRFDVLAVDLPGANPVEHIVDAFSELL